MKKTILVADHSHVYLKHISVILGRMGFAILPVEHAVDIIKTLKTNRPALILIDEDISKSHKIELLDWLRNSKSLADIPVIIMSFHPNRAMSQACKLHGCAEYIKKPIRLHRLHKLLEDHIYTPHGYHRRHLRALYYSKVGIVYKGAKKAFMAESLSEGGIFVSTENPLPVDAEVDVHIDLEHGRIFAIHGRVIYINPLKAKGDDTIRGMAIEFMNPDKNIMAIISDYVQGLLTIPTFIPK